MRDIFDMTLRAKIINSFFKDEDEEIGKLLLLQEFQDNKTIEVSDLIKQKILSVLNVEDDLNDIPLEKLYLVDSLRNGNTIDISQLISMKLLNQILGDTPKKKGDEIFIIARNASSDKTLYYADKDTWVHSTRKARRFATSDEAASFISTKKERSDFNGAFVISILLNDLPKSEGDTGQEDGLDFDISGTPNGSRPSVAQSNGVEYKEEGEF